MLTEMMYLNGTLQKLLDPIELMPMAKMRLLRKSKAISPADTSAVVTKALQDLPKLLRPGMKIGITAGSRGIDRIADITFRICRIVEEAGASPHIVPCMGSHGGNAEGQKLILENFGISQKTMQAPIISQEDLSIVGTTADSRPVYIDSFLLSCDGIIVVNRIKPHTAFHGEVESGLQKMMAVGMGKQKGASACHIDGFAGMYDKIIANASIIFNTGKIIFGLGIIENSEGKLCELYGIPGYKIQTEEPGLLLKAKQLMPVLPFTDLDLLIIDEMGKDISGSGMDTNVIGRYPTPDMQGGPSVGKIVVLSLTPGSKGNGHGMGFADFISARLFNHVVFEKTYINGFTNRILEPARIPIVMPTDLDTIKAGIFFCSSRDPGKIRAVRIKNTHNLDKIFVSASLLSKINHEWEVITKPESIMFHNNRTIINTW